MVEQIPVPQAKYELLLKNVRQTSWRSNGVWCLRVLVAVAGIFLVIWGLSEYSLAYREQQDFKEKLRNIFVDQDAKIVAWTRRAGMYAESTKENQNADRNSTIATSRQSFNIDSPSGKIVVCYYTIPGNLNPSEELSPSHIDPNICTHIIVGFASVVNCTLNLGEQSEIFSRVSSLKKLAPKLKVMISAGGINELPGYGFPEMVKTHANRKIFIRSVLNLTKEYNMDGLDVDWEFPAWLGANGRERIFFVQLLQELRRAFDKSGRELILSAAVAAPIAIIDDSYNVPQIAEHVDFVNIMAYDYHFFVWYMPLTGLNSPLFAGSYESGYSATLNVNYSAMYWLNKGMPKDKIVIGVPTYGHSYTLDNTDNHGINAPAKGLGKLGEQGFVKYPTVCDVIKTGGEKIFDEDSRTPYIYQEDNWISFDDKVSVKEKSDWIKYNGFKGVMIFSINTDDWNATCDGKTNFPLTKIASSVLLDSTDRGL